MKKGIVIVLFATIFLTLSSVNATTQFDVDRKAIKIYDKFDLNEIITTDTDNFTFTSSDESVVEVDEEGIIRALTLGQAVITVTDDDGTDEIIISSGYYTGIDVSSYNGTVDWEKVKKAGIDFAMIRAGYGWYDEDDIAAGVAFEAQVDTQLLNNLKGAIDNNISFGVYHVCYATTLEKADKEAAYLIQILDEYAADYTGSMTLPIAYDVEVEKLKAVGKATLTQIVIEFCTKLYEAGYTPIIYSYKSFINNYLDLDMINAMAYNIWYAYYGTNNPDNTDFSSKITVCDTKLTPFMWQYSSQGSIDGANTSSGAVDLNIMYMSDRVKVQISSEGQVVDYIGVDKGEAIEEFPELTKTGYTLSKFVDSNNLTVDSSYTFSGDATISAVFEKIPFTSLTLNIHSIEEDTLTPEETYILSISSYSPSTAIIEEGDIAYKSSDESVAKVNENGEIEFIGEGECILSAYYTKDETIIDTCSVSITLPALKGDMNEDKYINSTDAALVLDRYKNGDTTTKDLKLGDMDNNGFLNSTDAAQILDIYKNS